MKKLYNKLGSPIVHKENKLKKLNSSIFEIGPNIDFNQYPIKRTTLEFNSSNIYDNIKRKKKIKTKSKSLNPNSKNRNKLKRRTIVYKNIRKSNCKLNLKKKENFLLCQIKMI